MKCLVSRFLLLAALLFVPNGISVAQLQVGQAVGPNTIDATKFPGADPCAQIANAFIALFNTYPGGGAVNAAGFTSIPACTTSMFSPWYGASPTIARPTSSATIFPATLIWGSKPLPVGAYPQIPPPGVQVGIYAAGNGPSLTIIPNIPVSQSVLSGATYAVSTGGSGTACTLAAPCTLTQAKANAVAGSGNAKTIYLRAGTYTLSSAGTACSASDGLEVTATGDTGTTYSYYPPDGYNTAIITGANTVNTGFCIGPGGLANNVTINGIQVTGFVTLIAQYFGPNYILNNILHDNTTGNAANAAFATNTSYIAANNFIYNITNEALNAVASTSTNNSAIDGTIFANNVTIDTCTNSADCGSLYMEDLATTTHSAGLFMINNYVRNGNNTAAHGSGHGPSLYLDECVSNVVMAGNVITGNLGDWPVQINGGNAVSFFGNIIDIALTTRWLAGILDFHSGIALCALTTNNYFSNIYISGGGGGKWNGANTLTTQPVVTNNNYYTYAGTALGTGSQGFGPADASPWVVNPQFTPQSMLYTIPPGSPVYNAPINFPPIRGGWGPPGFVMPPVAANNSGGSQPPPQPVTHIGSQGAPPVLTSCGTSPTIVGNDTAGQVTMGTGTPTGCVITFNTPYQTAPICSLDWLATPLASQSYAVSATAITLTQTATSSNKVMYICHALGAW